MNKYGKIINVKIIDYKPDSWYKNRLGEIIKVYENIQNIDSDHEMYRSVNNNGNKILLKNCVVLTDREVFPTLSDDYCNKCT